MNKETWWVCDFVSKDGEAAKRYYVKLEPDALQIDLKDPSGFLARSLATIKITADDFAARFPGQALARLAASSVTLAACLRENGGWCNTSLPMVSPSEPISPHVLGVKELLKEAGLTVWG